MQGSRGKGLLVPIARERAGEHRRSERRFLVRRDTNEEAALRGELVDARETCFFLSLSCPSLRGEPLLLHGFTGVPGLVALLLCNETLPFLSPSSVLSLAILNEEENRQDRGNAERDAHAG
jgi:hypothetical protein